VTGCGTSAASPLKREKVKAKKETVVVYSPIGGNLSAREDGCAKASTDRLGKKKLPEKNSLANAKEK